MRDGLQIRDLTPQDAPQPAFVGLKCYLFMDHGEQGSILHDTARQNDGIWRNGEDEGGAQGGQPVDGEKVVRKISEEKIEAN